jgi:polysaccharide export outer membrane protein
MKFSLPNSGFYAIIGISLALLFGFSSCTTTKKLKYFNDLPDSTHVFLPPMPKQERVIEYGDQINIQISAEEKEAVAYFNAQGSGSAGFVVNPLGYVEFPIIGKVKVLGLTERQLKESLTQAVGKYVKDPMIDVRFTTFRVTVLGEVKSPGTFVMDMQRTTIFQALALAGDLPNTAKRSDIQLYRDYNGERAIIKFDLSKKDILYNPEVFELRHNDVLYVQPFRKTLFRENFTFVSSIVGVVIGIFSIGYIILNNNN